MSTPPPSLLGPLSEPWAREITRQVQDNETALQRLGGDFSSDGSVSNSALDTVAFQINELQQRRSGVIIYPDFTTSAFSNPSSVTNSITIQLPRPDARRFGTVSVQFTAVNSNTLQTEVYGSMEIDGNVFHRDSRAVPTQNFEPASWRGEKALTGFTGFQAGPGFGGTITLTLQAEAAFSTGSRQVTYTNIQANYQYGQRV